MRPRSRSVLLWIALTAVTVASLATAYGAYQLAGYAWDEVVEYKSPYVERPAATPDTTTSVPWAAPALTGSYSTTAPVLAQRVVLVIVDGMRDDVSRSEMSVLTRLRTYGADITLTAPQPSLSYPNWTTILSGAPQDISGVTTNWFEGRVAVPTLVDVAAQSGRRVAVIGPEDFSTLYGIEKGPAVSLRPWPKGGYLSATLIDDALRIAKLTDPQLMVVHLPDLDEAGHEYGGDSKEYRDVAHKIGIDLARLVDGMQRDDTAFIVVADHGHIATGGHGGWEPVVTTVPGVFAGAGIQLGVSTGRLEQVAPTIAVLSGTPVPAFASARSLRSAVATTALRPFRQDNSHHLAFATHYIDSVTQGVSTINSGQLAGKTPTEADAVMASAKDERLATERNARVRNALIALAAIVLAVALIGLASWRALVAALAGTLGYYVVYNLLFFSFHGFNWSLSAFNTETFVKAFMNGRMVEAIFSGLIGAAVAALVYPLLRRQPRGPRDPWYLSGWLALGPSTILVVQATLAMQVAWYYWWYGINISWVLPDFKWAFKADLDMVQVTALGAAALLAPLVTYLVGRYHPKVARVRAGDGVAGPKT